jgi:hypothetical protein
MHLESGFRALLCETQPMPRRRLEALLPAYIRCEAREPRAFLGHPSICAGRMHRRLRALIEPSWAAAVPPRSVGPVAVCAYPAGGVMPLARLMTIMATAHSAMASPSASRELVSRRGHALGQRSVGIHLLQRMLCTRWSRLRALRFSSRLARRVDPWARSSLWRREPEPTCSRFVPRRLARDQRRQRLCDERRTPSHIRLPRGASE